MNWSDGWWIASPSPHVSFSLSLSDEPTRMERGYEWKQTQLLWRHARNEEKWIKIVSLSSLVDSKWLAPSQPYSRLFFSSFFCTTKSFLEMKLVLRAFFHSNFYRNFPVCLAKKGWKSSRWKRKKKEGKSSAIAPLFFRISRTLAMLMRPLGIARTREFLLETHSSLFPSPWRRYSIHKTTTSEKAKFWQRTKIFCNPSFR